MRRCRFAPLLLLAGLAVAAPVQANLLNNGGFEDPLFFGDPPDPSTWSGFFGSPPEAPALLTGTNDTGAPAFTGSQALELSIFGDTDSSGAPINGTNSFAGHQQLVSGINPGDELIYSVYARNNDSGLTGNVEFRLEFRDAGGIEVGRRQINLEELGLSNQYQLFSIDDAVAPAGTASVNAVFAVASFNQDVFHDHSVLFDDVSLTIAAIPEPASLSLLGLAAGLLGLRRRK